MVDLEELSAVLNVGSHEHIAVVGGGGKTTILHALGRQLSGTRLLTTTTKMGFDQHGGLPVTVLSSGCSTAAAALSWPGEAAVVWAEVEEPVALGVDPALCDEWFAEVDHVIVEADGARRRPFKAPASYEPVVPTTATIMISTIGADALGEIIDERCHRPALVAGLAGCNPGDRLTPARAARVLVHGDGCRRALPAGARLVVAITKVDAARTAAAEELMAVLAARGDVDHVTIRHHGR